VVGWSWMKALTRCSTSPECRLAEPDIATVAPRQARGLRWEPARSGFSVIGKSSVFRFSRYPGMCIIVHILPAAGFHPKSSILNPLSSLLAATPPMLPPQLGHSQVEVEVKIESELLRDGRHEVHDLERCRDRVVERVQEQLAVQRRTQVEVEVKVKVKTQKQVQARTQTDTQCRPRRPPRRTLRRRLRCELQERRQST
jgi:hypothetical protein